MGWQSGLKLRQEQTQTSIKAEAAVRKAFDEMNGTGNGVRAPYHAVSEWLERDWPFPRVEYGTRD